MRDWARVKSSYLGSTDPYRAMDNIQGGGVRNSNGEKYYILVFTDLYLNFNISFYYDCRQQTTVILESVTSSAKEIIDFL